MPESSRQAAAEARAANAEIRAANAGLAELKSRAVGLAGDLVTPMVLLARGASVTRAAFEGVKAAIIGRVLGPLGAVSGAALGLLGTIKVLTMAFGRAGVESRAALEKMEKSFQPLMKSAAGARARVKELMEFSRNTPFRFESVAEANKTLQYLTKGALATKEGMRLVGDAAAASGNDFNETAFAVGKLYEGIQNGAPIERAAMRLEWMGMISAGTARRLATLQESGASATEVWREMERDLQRNSGGMAVMSQTLDKMRGRLEEAKQTASAAFGQGFMVGEKATVDATTKAVENLTPAFETLGSILGVVPNALGRLKAGFLEFIAAGKSAGAIFLGVAQGLGILLASVVAVQGVQIGRVAMGFLGLGSAQKAAATAAVGLQSISRRLAAAMAELAAGNVGAAMGYLRLAGAKAIVAVRTNGLASVVGVLFKGMRMLFGLLGSVGRSVWAAFWTTTGLASTVLMGLTLAVFHYYRALKQASDAVRASREASEAHTASLREQVRTMTSAEDAARAHASAMQELRDAEMEAQKAREKYSGGSWWKSALNAAFGVGDDEIAAAEAREKEARAKVREMEALDATKLGTDEDTRQQRRQFTQDMAGERFYQGVTLEKAEAEEAAKDATRLALQGQGEQGRRLRDLTKRRDALRQGDTTDLKSLTALNARIAAERRQIMESSGSVEMRARAKLAEDDERLDLARQADKAEALYGKVTRADGHKEMADLAAEVEDAMLKKALATGQGTQAVTRAYALASRARAQALDAGDPMDPKDRQALMSEVENERARYDKQKARQNDLARMEAGFDIQRAQGEARISALKDEGYDAAMREIEARKGMLDLEEQITAEKLKQGLLSEEAAAADRARVAAQRAELEAQARLNREQTERATRQAAHAMKANAWETRAAELRHAGNQSAAEVAERMADQNQLAGRRIEMERAAKDLSAEELRRQGFASQEDYVAKGMAYERQRIEQQRRFTEEERGMARRRASADADTGTGDVVGRILQMQGRTMEGKQVEEAAKRRADEVRREELRRQYISQGVEAAQARSLADQTIKNEQAARALDALGTGVGTTVASSMAAIGGGGGVAGVDLMVDRQEKTNRLLQDIKDNTKKSVTNVINEMG